MMLVNSLKGYNTGWCTAGETVAKEQLANGDFYVYYTLDENGEYKVPRIAIRMEYGSIAEIRSHVESEVLHLDKLSGADGLIFPEELTYSISINNGETIITSENVHMYRKNTQNNNGSSKK